MTNNKNQLLGILGIIFGIFLISFPLVGAVTASILAGLGLLFVGIWLMALSFDTWGTNNIASLAALIIAILSIMIGLGLMGNIVAFDLIVDSAFYIVGIFLLLNGIWLLFTTHVNFNRFLGAIGIITGVLYVYLAFIEFDTIFLTFVLGLWLLFGGAMQFVTNDNLEQ